MDWLATELAPGITVFGVLSIFGLPILSIASRVIRKAWRSPKMAALTVWGYVGMVLVLAQAGDDPVTGTQMVLAIIGVSSVGLSLWIAILIEEQKLIASYKREHKIDAHPNQ